MLETSLVVRRRLADLWHAAERRPLAAALVTLTCAFGMGSCSASAISWGATRPSKNLRWSSCATSQPFCVYIVDRGTDWIPFPFASEARMEVWVGREGQEVENLRGHRTRYSPHQGKADVVAHLARCSVSWTEEGMVFVEPTGHRLFIPSEAYVNLR